MRSKFDACLALQLAQVSKLAYCDPETMKELALDGGFLDALFFDNNGTQAYLIAGPSVLILVFRGTEWSEKEDVKADFTADLVLSAVGPVHRGFYQALNQVWYDVESAILTFLGCENITRVYITGHSLGGALATLAAARLRMRQILVSELYTFGTPRVGSASFAHWMNSNFAKGYFRLVHNNDVVPRLPPPLWYRHAGELIYIDSKGNVKVNSRRWGRLFDRIKGRLKAIFESGLDGIKDHDVERYIEALKREKEKQNGVRTSPRK